MTQADTAYAIRAGFLSFDLLPSTFSQDKQDKTRVATLFQKFAADSLQLSGNAKFPLTGSAVATPVISITGAPG